MIRAVVLCAMLVLALSCEKEDKYHHDAYCNGILKAHVAFTTSLPDEDDPLFRDRPEGVSPILVALEHLDSEHACGNFF